MERNLAGLVRRRRLELRLTQRAAAAAAEISLATWQAVERTAAGEDFQELTLARVAHALDLPMEEVFAAAGRSPAAHDGPPPASGPGDPAGPGGRAPAAASRTGGGQEARMKAATAALRTISREAPQVFDTLCAHIEQVAATVRDRAEGDAKRGSAR